MGGKESALRQRRLPNINQIGSMYFWFLLPRFYVGNMNEYLEKWKKQEWKSEFREGLCGTSYGGKNACRVLSDPIKRREYDNKGMLYKYDYAVVEYLNLSRGFYWLAMASELSIQFGRNRNTILS